MGEKDFESDFVEDDLDLSLTQVNISTEFGNATVYVPAYFSKEEFDAHIEGIFKGISMTYEFLTGISATVIPIFQGSEDTSE